MLPMHVSDSDKLLHIETRALQRQVRSKIKAKYYTFYQL